tara:strand:- start:2115 stop:2672 length:558 start_codon:yes stop_codon:yes gene_type:complete
MQVSNKNGTVTKATAPAQQKTEDRSLQVQDNTSKKQNKVTNTLKEAMLEFQKLAVSAKKDGKNPHFNSNYSSLESVIEAAKYGNQFGLYFTQDLTYEYVENDDHKNSTVPIVRTVIHHVKDSSVLESKLPIMLSKPNMENPQKIGSAITYYKRYTLQSLYGLPSEDDDGNQVSNENKSSSNSSWR